MSADLEVPRLPLNGSFMPSAAIKSSYDGDFLQTTRQQDSQHYSKEIIKGFVIVLPMIVALILAPMLLSYSRRRLFSRKKSRIRCCCRRKTTHNNRDDQRVIIEISEQNIDGEGATVREQIVEKFPMKPTLKKSKMFVETAGITSDANETQVEEAEVPDVDDASVRCFPEISLVNFGAKMLDRRRCDEGQSTTHSRLTVFENNAYEDTIPSLVESNVDVSYASSPVTQLPNVNFWHFSQNKDSPNMGIKKTTNIHSPLQMSQFPRASRSYSTHFERNHGMIGTRLSQSRVRRHFSNKERWQPLYSKPKDPETVSMLGYEFANDVIHGHVPPSPLLPAPCRGNVSNGISELQSPRDNAVANDYTICRPVTKEVKSSSISTKLSTVSQQIYAPQAAVTSSKLSPQAGAASTKLSTVSTRRSKRKMKKSRRYRDQLRHRWQRRLPVFNTGFQFGTINSYGPGNNDKISGYIGTRPNGNMIEEDDFEGALIRHRIQLSETTLLEEIWQHVKMIVERTNQEQGSPDDKEGVSERNSEESSAHTVVPSTNEQIDSPDQHETTTTDHSSSGISVQMYPCIVDLEA